jgi:hypothetical protein
VFTEGSIIGERTLFIERVGRTPLTIHCREAGVLFVLPKQVSSPVFKAGPALCSFCPAHAARAALREHRPRALTQRLSEAPYTIHARSTRVRVSSASQAFFTIQSHVASGSGVDTDTIGFLRSSVPSLEGAANEGVSALSNALKVKVKPTGAAIVGGGSENADGSFKAADGVLIVKAGTLRVPLPRPLAKAASGSAVPDDAEAPALVFHVGDVISESQLLTLGSPLRAGGPPGVFASENVRCSR